MFYKTPCVQNRAFTELRCSSHRILCMNDSVSVACARMNAPSHITRTVHKPVITASTCTTHNLYLWLLGISFPNSLDHGLIMTMDIHKHCASAWETYLCYTTTSTTLQHHSDPSKHWFQSFPGSCTSAGSWEVTVSIIIIGVMNAINVILICILYNLQRTQ